MTELRAFYLSKYDSDENVRELLMSYHRSRPYKSKSKYTDPRYNLSASELKEFISHYNDFFKTVARHILKALENINPEEYITSLNNYSQKSQKSLIRYYLNSLNHSENINNTSTNENLIDVLAGKSADFQQQIIGDTHRDSRSITTVYRWDDMQKFIGRRDELELLHRKLSKAKFVVVHGMKGIGKTSLVQAYVTKHYSDYDNLVWIPVTAGLDKSIETTFHGLEIEGNHVDVPDTNPNSWISVDVILQYLNNLPGRNLLIIDGANDRFELKRFLNKLEHIDWRWKTICTSFINPKIPDEIELCELKPSDGFKLFSVYYNEDVDINLQVRNEALIKKHKSQIMDMLNEVKNHTLLIELIAKLSSEDELMTIEQLTRLVKGPESLKEARFNFPVQPNIMDPRANRILAVDMTPYNYILTLFRADLERLNPEESMILMYFSVLPTKPIRRCDLLHLFYMEEDHLMALLARTKGWIKYDKKTDSFSMEELYQFVIREILRPDAADCGLLIGQVIERLTDFDQCMNECHTIIGEYIDFAESLISHFKVTIRDINPEDDEALRSVLIDNIYSFEGVNDSSVSQQNAELHICVAANKLKQGLFTESYQLSLNAALMLLSLKLQASMLFYESLLIVADSLKISKINIDAADEILAFVEKKSYSHQLKKNT